MFIETLVIVGVAIVVKPPIGISAFYRTLVKVRGGGANRKMAQMIMQRSQGKIRATRRKYLKNLAGTPATLPRRHKSETPPSTSPVEVSFIFDVLVRISLDVVQYDPGVTGKG